MSPLMDVAVAVGSSASPPVILPPRSPTCPANLPCASAACCHDLPRRPRRSRSRPRRSRSRTGPLSSPSNCVRSPRCFRRTTVSRFDRGQARFCFTQSRCGLWLASLVVSGRQARDPRSPWRPAVSAAARRCLTAAAGSCAPNTAVPATKTSAPASAQRPMVSSVTPPSTCSQISPPCLRDQFACPGDLRQHQVKEVLTAEPWLDGHHQQHVDLGQQVRVRLDRCRRVQRQARPRPGGPDRPQRPHRRRWPPRRGS